MWSEVPENAGCGLIRLLAPGVGLDLETEAVEANLKFGNPSQFARCNELPNSMGSPVPAAALIDPAQAAPFRRQTGHLPCLRHCWTAPVREHNIAGSLHAILGL